MRWQEISEAPITNWEVDPELDAREKEMTSKFHGYDREQKHWRDKDKKLIRDPEHIKKIKDSFLKVPANFNLFFWQSTEPDYDPYLEKGVVDMNWIKKHMSDNVVKYLEKTNTNNAINIIMTNNLADPNYIPLKSGWMVGHRIAHVLIGGSTAQEASYQIQHLFDNFIRTIVTEYYGHDWHEDYAIEMDYLDAYGKELAYAIGTMKSARNKNLNTYWEWMYETFVQYLITGDIKFKDAPDELSEEKKRKPTKQLILKFKNDLKESFDKLLRDSQGKIFVM